MPTIRIDMVEGRTVEQKRELARRITDAVVDVTGARPERVTIYFRDLAKGDVSQGGKLRCDSDS